MREIYQTDIECIMYNYLKDNNITFVNEFPIRCKYGYRLDFAIPELKIDIECDGSIWHLENNSRDNKRNNFLIKKGWIILRFKEEEIKSNIDICIAKIKEIIERRLKEYGNKS